MPDRKMTVHWEDGAELSQSLKKPGNFSPLTRDRDNNLGHVTLSDVDEDEGLTKEELLGALFLVAVAVAAGVIAAPQIRRWWDDRAVPFLKKSRSRLSKDPGARGNVSVAEPLMLPQSASTESSQEVIASLDEHRARAGEEILAEIGKILGRSSQGDGECVPVRSGRINRALHLPRRGE